MGRAVGSDMVFSPWAGRHETAVVSVMSGVW